MKTELTVESPAALHTLSCVKHEPDICLWNEMKLSTSGLGSQPTHSAFGNTSYFQGDLLFIGTPGTQGLCLVLGELTL